MYSDSFSDGRKPFPIAHGPTKESSFLDDAAGVSKKFMEREPDNLQFTAIAISKVEWTQVKSTMDSLHHIHTFLIVLADDVITASFPEIALSTVDSSWKFRMDKRPQIVSCQKKKQLSDERKRNVRPVNVVHLCVFCGFFHRAIVF